MLQNKNQYCICKLMIIYLP